MKKVTCFVCSNFMLLADVLDVLKQVFILSYLGERSRNVRWMKKLPLPMCHQQRDE